MATIYVYNPNTNQIESYTRSGNQAMPYAGNTLTIAEFQSNSRTSVLWTDRRVMETWSTFRRIWGQPIYVGYCFKRIWEGGHTGQSQHYAGTAFDVGQNLTPTVRNALRNTAITTGLWSYVEPASLTPTWVHIDKRLGPPACYGGGFPLLNRGSIGIYVFVLQDALNALGYTGSGLDGIFGAGTQRAVQNFQSAQGLASDGIVGCATWTSLTDQANGIGLTGTVVNP